MKRSAASALLWGALIIAALAWPGRFIGPFDGAPLDVPLEAIAIGLLLPALWCLHPVFLRTAAARSVIVTLLAWKLITAVLIPQAGWCGTFLTNYDPRIGGSRFAPSWDARIFWQSPLPACSAIVSHGYTRQTQFPAWIINIPFGRDRIVDIDQDDANVVDVPRPPAGHFTMLVDGTMHSAAAGVFSVETGSDEHLTGVVDGQSLSAASGATAAVPLGAGTHAVNLRLDLTGRGWKFVPLWNGRDVFSALPTSTTAPTLIARLIQSTGRWVAPMLVVALFGGWFWSAVRSIRPPAAVVGAVVAIAACAGWLASRGDSPAARFAAVPIAASVCIPVPRRLRNSRGLLLLAGIPWLALIAARGARFVGAFTLYYIGDDTLDYQRFAYRIFKEGYWLEGGQRTFWNQPLYRWICGALHVFYGDSSVGELFWDGFTLLVGAVFAYHVAKRMAGFRAGMAAAVAVFLTVTLGPNFYLLGRGLPEIAAAGWLSMAALCLLRARSGATRFAMAGGIFAVLAFLTRLNHLPLVVGLVALLLPFPRRSPGRTVRSRWAYAVLRREAAVYLSVVVCGIGAFALRTWYYTGELSLFAGTTRVHNATGFGLTFQSLWAADAWRNALESVLMIVTVADPPRFDPRAFFVIAGVAWAALWALRAPIAFRVPAGPAIVCLSALAAGLFVRGLAYPGRFSIHLIPVAVAIAVGSFASLLGPLASRYRAGAT